MSLDSNPPDKVNPKTSRTWLKVNFDIVRYIFQDRAKKKMATTDISQCIKEIKETCEYSLGTEENL